MAFIQARNYTPVARRAISLIVLHDMEAPETRSTAENVARWFAGPTAPQASAHYCIDNDSIVQCVYDHDVAWHAPGANHDGLGFEHAGYARQTRADWLDAYSRSMLELSAKLAANKCLRYSIPARFLDAAGLKAGKRGVTTHAEVSLAYGGTHTDPGPNFPVDYYMRRVRYYLTLRQRLLIRAKHHLRLGRHA